MMTFQIPQPDIFSFKECLWYIDRSFLDATHFIENESVYKWLTVNDEELLIRLHENEDGAALDVLNRDSISNDEQSLLTGYISDWLDLEGDLASFYKLVEKDRLLAKLVKQYRGLRIIGIPDLFEALCWSIIGQQVNLTFAFKLKSALVESFGKKLAYEEHPLYIFPKPAQIASLEIDDFTGLQFSRRKAEYIIDLANMFVENAIDKASLKALGSLEEIVARLVEIRGIGKWTANYVAMRCLKMKDAFPIEDVGLHNAIKNQLDMYEKPSIAEIAEMADSWKPFRAYATLYLWRSLADKK
ncbi:MAG: DNA-3-methyladenine glycosylase [Bacteroidota bacterium]